MTAWTPCEDEILRTWFPHVPTRPLAADLGRSEGAVNVRAQSLGLKKTSECIEANRHIPRRGTPWAEADLQVLRQQWADHTAAEVVDMLGGRHNIGSVRNKADSLGLTKSAEFWQSPKSGRCSRANPIPGGERTRWQSGHVPWIAGKAGTGALKANAGSFRKGNTPHNHQPVGTIARTTGECYLKVKVAEPNVWEFVHLRTWQQHHGPIPDGFMVRFRDGNNQNCDIGNLECISKADHMHQHTFQRYPAELQQAMRALWMLQRRIRKHGEE